MPTCTWIDHVAIPGNCQNYNTRTRGLRSPRFCLGVCMNTFNRRSFHSLMGAGALGIAAGLSASAQGNKRPNILFAIADDWSWPHAGVYGDPVIQTPGFDRIAEQGCLFSNAFACAPQCSPNRASILLGRHIWQNREAGTHSSYFPKDNPVFTDLLEDSGYVLGSTGKIWGPGNYRDRGWERNPVGPSLNKHRLETPPTDSISSIDYARNFEAFLESKPNDKPFFFWYGAQEPHRGYEWKSYDRDRMLEKVIVPDFLPDDPIIRQDILDYYLEVEWFDQHLNRMLSRLDAMGELENTLVIATSDNGMPFPRAKANLYEYGVHMPLAISFPGETGSGQTIDDLVSFVDLAPTILDTAGVEKPASMIGQSLMRRMKQETSDTQPFVLFGRERHSHSRYDNLGYPSRAIRDDRHLLIWNCEPDRWPAGTPDWFHDIDACPTLTFLKDNRDHPAVKPYFEMSVQKRPALEFFDIQTDPGCIHNLADSAEHQPAMRTLQHQMLSVLEKQNDPRVKGYGFVTESYPRFGSMRAYLGGFHERTVYNPNVRR